MDAASVIQDNVPSDAGTGWVRGLDARQRAMLREMGVTVWAPRSMNPGGSAESQDRPETTVRPPIARPATPLSTPDARSQPGAEAATASPAPLSLRQDSRPAPAPSAVPAAPSLNVSEVATLDWPSLEAAVSSCQACGLCRSRRQTVFGVGDRSAPWMVVGEAPGEHEDRQGEPFVGGTGQLLDAMLEAVGRRRDAQGETGVYIANVLKCRPPGNRNPAPDEVARCEPFLARQVALVKPRLILAMGRFAVQSLLQTTEPIGRLRGRVHRYQGVPVIVTYHPAYLLRNLPDKAKSWADLCLALETEALLRAEDPASPGLDRPA